MSDKTSKCARCNDSGYYQSDGLGTLICECPAAPFPFGKPAPDESRFEEWWNAPATPQELHTIRSESTNSEHAHALIAWRAARNIPSDRCTLCKNYKAPCQNCADGKCPMTYGHGMNDLLTRCGICGWRLFQNAAPPKETDESRLIVTSDGYLAARSGELVCAQTGLPFTQCDTKPDDHQHYVWTATPSEILAALTSERSKRLELVERLRALMTHPGQVWVRAREVMAILDEVEGGS